MTDHKPHPLQPLTEDARGVARFKENKIVRYLIDHGSIDLNALARIDFPQEDREQLAMLIGYSLDGFSTLSYVSDATYEAAARSRLSDAAEPEHKVPAEWNDERIRTVALSIAGVHLSAEHGELAIRHTTGGVIVDEILLKFARALLASAPAAAPAVADDWHVDVSVLAGQIMQTLGRNTDPSLEPGADPMRDRIAAMIEGFSPAVPADMVLVPREPTDVMLDRAVAFALNVRIGSDYGWTSYMRDLWSRMIAVAPASRKEEAAHAECLRDVLNAAHPTTRDLTNLEIIRAVRDGVLAKGVELDDDTDEFAADVAAGNPEAVAFIAGLRSLIAADRAANGWGGAA